VIILVFSIQNISYSKIPKRLQENGISIRFDWLDVNIVPRIDKIAKFLLNNEGITKKEYNELIDELPQLFDNLKIRKCILDVLFTHYFRFDQDPDVIQTLEQLRIQNSKFENIQSIREFIWDYIGKNYNGFIMPKFRQKVLEEMFNSYQIDLDKLEKLIWSDMESEKILRNIRIIEPVDIVYLYNFHLFETILHSTDCATFFIENLKGKVSKNLLFRLKYTPLWAEIRRVKDLEQEKITSRFKFTISIEKPKEITGNLKYNKIMSRICIYLLEKLKYDRIKFNVFLNLKIKNRFYKWAFDNEFMKIIKYPWEIQWKNKIDKLNEGKDKDNEIEDISKTFLKLDSKIEELFYTYFNSKDWNIQHEPLTIITEDNTLFIPDFYLQNPAGNILVEIIGYWTKDYISKKILKLKKVQHRLTNPLILLIDNRLKNAFEKASELNKWYKIFYYDYDYFSQVLLKLRQYLDNKYPIESIIKNEIVKNADKIIIIINSIIQEKGLLTLKELKQILEKSELNIPSVSILDKIFCNSKLDEYLIRNGLSYIPNLGIIKLELKRLILKQIDSLLKKEGKVSNKILENSIKIPYDDINIVEIIKNLPEIDIKWIGLTKFYIKLKKKNIQKIF